jgi:hypothetical protein
LGGSVKGKRGRKGKEGKKEKEKERKRTEVNPLMNANER